MIFTKIFTQISKKIARISKKKLLKCYIYSVHLSFSYNFPGTKQTTTNSNQKSNLDLGITPQPAINFLQRHGRRVGMRHGKRKSVAVVGQVALAAPRPPSLPRIDLGVFLVARNSFLRYDVVVVGDDSGDAGGIDGGREIEDPPWE